MSIWCSCDIIPQSSAPLLQPKLQELMGPSLIWGPASPLAESSDLHLAVWTHSPCLDSAQNGFHIFCQYHASELPSHDPDKELSLEDFSEIPKPSSSGECDSLIGSSIYAPYPNKSLFLLSKWFWKPRAQISQKDFKSLLDLLNDSGFNLRDIKGTRWDFINQQLENMGKPDLWSDKSWLNDMDAGWMEEPIVLNVPFPKRSAIPGIKPFEAGTFYRCSLIAILCKRISAADGHHVHYDPYELYWQPDLRKAPMCVFGELYTLPEFIHIHQELQRNLLLNLDVVCCIMWLA